MNTQLKSIFILTLSSALSVASVARADTWTTLNPDGSITKTEITAAGEVKGTSTTPAVPVAKSAASRHDSDDRRNRGGHSRTQIGIGAYVPYYQPYYAQTYPYSYQLPGFAPFGGPIISSLPLPGVQTYPIYGAPVYPYPTYGYPYPVYTYPSYPYPTNPYPVYSYPSYPYGTGTYSTNSTYGGVTLGTGGVSVTIGGSRSRTQTSTSIWDQ